MIVPLPDFAVESEIGGPFFAPSVGDRPGDCCAASYGFPPYAAFAPLLRALGDGTLDEPQRRLSDSRVAEREEA